VAIDSIARPTVGRDAELAKVDGVLDGLTRPGCACLVVEGEPGIGKTRLLAELRERAAERGHLVLAGSAAEFERDVALSVWADALDEHLGEELELDALVAEERYRVHRAVRALLERLAGNGAVVAVLDDLHWSDDASVELIGALLRRGPAAPVLLALAYRRGQGPERLRAALSTPAVQRLTLGELSEDAATELLSDLDQRAARDLFRHAGGNPFYLEQLARVAPADGDGGDEMSDGIPAAVAASLAEELSVLGTTERALLDGAAIAGEPFDPDVAAAIAEVDEAQALAALDDLLARGVVRPTAVPRRFVFRHPLVRSAVYESTRGGWRLAAHGRAADALAARGALPAERAHHVEQAARPCDEEAIALLVEAGETTAPRAPAAAARWFEAALRLLPSGDAERQTEVRLALAGALRSSGELERCRETVLEALELLGGATGERHVELMALCAAVEHWLGRHEAAHARLVRAWEALPDRSTAASAALQVELAIDGMYELDFEQVLTHAEGALETARAVGTPRLIAVASAARCLGEAAAGHVEPAQRHVAETAKLVDGLPDSELALRLETFIYLAWAENYVERYEDALAHVDRGVAIGRAVGAGQLIIPTLLAKGYPFEMAGRLAEAQELCESAAEAMRVSGNPHYLFWSLFELGWARYYAGDLEGAIRAGEESARVGHRLSGGTMPSAGGGPGWMLACARFMAGETERAWEEMQALGNGELAHKIPVEKCFDWEVYALISLKLGMRAEAEDYAARGEQNAASLAPLQVPAAVAGRTRAALLLADGDAAEAARLARASYEAASSAGARLQAAFSLGLAGQALAATGARPEAITALREAERTLDECGSIRPRDELRRELRRLGARTEKRGPASEEDSGVAALTKREREIADLVHDRRTNREIAATLFLSDKTVESHLRNIFIKLSVSSRVDVARAIDREQQAAR
jgi:DNA-binding NarL/FixJ family response regulator